MFNTENNRSWKPLIVPSTLEELSSLSKKGSLGVITAEGKHDIVPGKFIGHYFHTGYVIAVKQ
ncbi:MAG: hypothetical protein ACLQF0_06670 [Dissulfurispiraceae bacterium]